MTENPRKAQWRRLGICCLLAGVLLVGVWLAWKPLLIGYHRWQMRWAMETAHDPRTDPTTQGDWLARYEHSRGRLVDLGCLARREFYLEHILAPTEESRHLCQQLCAAFPDTDLVEMDWHPEPQVAHITVWDRPERIPAWEAFMAERDVPDYAERFGPLVAKAESDIHAAAEVGDVGRVRELLADAPELASARNDDGYAPLYAAAEGGHTEVVQLLLAKGADAGAEHGHYHSTALHVAANREVAEALLAKGAGPNALSESVTPLHQAAGAGRLSVVEVLLANGARVGARTDWGATPLHFAASYGHCDVMGVLLAAGADINAKDDYGGTLLHGAALEGQADAVRFLLAKGVSPNVRTGRGETPLHKAAFWGHAPVAEVLLAAGADAALADKEGDTPQAVAGQMGHMQLARLLRSRVGMPPEKAQGGQAGARE